MQSENEYIPLNLLDRNIMSGVLPHKVARIIFVPGEVETNIVVVRGVGETLAKVNIDATTKSSIWVRWPKLH
jgi:hypothetical protein